jgi:hypothetical protein
LEGLFYPLPLLIGDSSRVLTRLKGRQIGVSDLQDPNIPFFKGSNPLPQSPRTRPIPLNSGARSVRNFVGYHSPTSIATNPISPHFKFQQIKRHLETLSAVPNPNPDDVTALFQPLQNFVQKHVAHMTAESSQQDPQHVAAQQPITPLPLLLLRGDRLPNFSENLREPSPTARLKVIISRYLRTEVEGLLKCGMGKNATEPHQVQKVRNCPPYSFHWFHWQTVPAADFFKPFAAQLFLKPSISHPDKPEPLHSLPDMGFKGEFGQQCPFNLL